MNELCPANGMQKYIISIKSAEKKLNQLGAIATLFVTPFHATVLFLYPLKT